MIRYAVLTAAVACFAETTAAVDAVSGLSVVKPLADVVCAVFGKLIPVSIALMMGAYAALLWIYSRDDPAMRERAKTMLLLIFVGLIVINIARGIIAIVFPAAANICP